MLLLLLSLFISPSEGYVLDSSYYNHQHNSIVDYDAGVVSSHKYGGDPQYQTSVETIEINDIYDPEMSPEARGASYHESGYASQPTVLDYEQSEHIDIDVKWRSVDNQAGAEGHLTVQENEYPYNEVEHEPFMYKPHHPGVESYKEDDYDSKPRSSETIYFDMDDEPQYSHVNASVEQHGPLRRNGVFSYYPQFEKYNPPDADDDLSDYADLLTSHHERKGAKLLSAFFYPEKTGPGARERQMRAYDSGDQIHVRDPLIDDSVTSLTYQKLRNCPHGRHLLLVTLLEGYGSKYWEPRCHNYIQMYLPDSLKDPDQPPIPPNACVLKEVVINGRTATRQQILRFYNGLVASRVKPNEKFSSFKLEHARAVNSVVKFILDLKDFDAIIAVLLVLKDSCHRKMFTKAVLVIIQSREDVGFILPSIASIHSEEFIPSSPRTVPAQQDSNPSWRPVQNGHNLNTVQHSSNSVDDEEEFLSQRLNADNANERDSRQTWRRTNNQPWQNNNQRWLQNNNQRWLQNNNQRLRQNNPPWRQNNPQPPNNPQPEPPSIPQPPPNNTPQRDRISFGSNSDHRTYPITNPEYQTWFLREDLLINTMHVTWHILLSSPNIGSLMARRGEMFYFIHKILLNRYNVERINANMPLVEAYLPADWGEDLPEAYDSNLGDTGTGATIAVRPAGRLRGPNVARMRDGYNRLMRDAARMNLQGTSLGYVNGVDQGISAVMDAAEAFAGDQRYNSVHNTGHITIGTMGFGSNCMAFTTTSMRDPLFYRWHTTIDNIASAYKSELGRYSRQDLSFPGVTVNEISVSTGDEENVMTTFLEYAPFRVSDEGTRIGGGGTLIDYERLNHDEYTFTIRVTSTEPREAIGRVFLLPTGHYPANEVFIEMDLFYISLDQGENTITRRGSDSPLFSQRQLDLATLQEDLMNGMGETEFNWGHCAPPYTLAVPKGSTNGMDFHLVFLIVPILPDERSNIAEWRNLEQTSFAWCGLQFGNVPSYRPMGFPFDRPSTTLNYVLEGSNALSTNIKIHHDGHREH